MLGREKMPKTFRDADKGIRCGKLNCAMSHKHGVCGEEVYYEEVAQIPPEPTGTKNPQFKHEQ